MKSQIFTKKFSQNSKKISQNFRDPFQIRLISSLTQTLNSCSGRLLGHGTFASANIAFIKTGNSHAIETKNKFIFSLNYGHPSVNEVVTFAIFSGSCD